MAICNGDLLYLDLVAEHASQLDLYGTNVYRGKSARDLYQRVKDELGVPIFYSEFGADAFDAKRMREDSVTQATYVRAQWEDIYENAYGHGVGNAIGGYQFQWSDGWWKHKQEENLDEHAHGWPNGGYAEDFVEGRNNMNEEWFGITAKGRPDENGHFYVYPRPAYYVLQKAWQLDPYAESTTADVIDAHFAAVDPASGLLTYQSSLDAMQARERSRAWVRGVRLDLTGVTTDDSTRLGTGKQRLDFDHGQSLYVDFGAQPTEAIEVRAEVNVLGNVAQNVIDPLTYESRAGKLIAVEDNPLTPEDESDPDDLALMQAADRVRLYQAEGSWEHDLFRMNAYYRVGHFHWGYEGDFFGLYREAFYGENIDIYDAAVPIGMEFEGKGALDGLAIAGGPGTGRQPRCLLRWSTWARPTTFIHQEDLTQQGVAAPTGPSQFVTRKTTVHMERNLGPACRPGGIMAAPTAWADRVDPETVVMGPATTAGYHLYEDEIHGWTPWAPRPSSCGSSKAHLRAGRVPRTCGRRRRRRHHYYGWFLSDGGQGMASNS